MAGLSFKALLIGCSSYPDDPHNLPALKGPPQDLRLIEDALTHPQVGLHARADVVSMLDGTKDEIVRAIETFFSAAGRDTQTLLYYSGHGRQDRSGRLHLCARDTRTDLIVSTGIADDQINSIIQNSAAGRVVIVLDCCHSGSFKGLDLPESLKGTGRFLLTSCRSRELSLDAVQGDGASAFTRLLVEGLLSGLTDMNSDGFVSLNEVYDFVLPRLRAETKQIPQRHFDHAVAEVAIGRAMPRTRESTQEITPVPGNVPGARPVLNVSETSIEIEGVKPGETLPPEIIDVFNEGGGALDWTAECDDDWIRAEQHKGFVRITLSPRPGVNRGRVHVRDRGKGGSKTIRVNVQMAEAPPPPRLEVSETSIDFGRLARGARVPPRTIRLRNAGGGDLRPQVTASAAWIGLRLYGETLDVSPETAAAGSFSGDIAVTSAGGQARIAVNAVVEPGPVLAVEPRGVDFGRRVAGEQASAEVAVRNAGTGELEWTFTPDCNFAHVTRTAAGFMVTLTGPPGRHHGTVHVSGNGGSVTVDVRAEVAERAPPPPPPPPPGAPEVRGRWNTGAGAIDIGGPGPQFQFVEYNAFGIVVSQGNAFQQGALVQFQGYHVMAGPFTAQMQVMGNRMNGAVAIAGGMMPLSLVRM